MKPISSYTDSNGALGAPHIGLVGEDGAEAIIPLSGSRRQRGLDLWAKAGRMLGVRPYAEGALVPAPVSAADSGFIGTSGQASTGAGGIYIDKIILENIEMNAGSNGSPSNNADELAGVLAEKLRQAFMNLPLATDGTY
jgi:hypothetical protein